MKAYLILEDGTVFAGTHIGAKKETISEIVFNTSMAGYPEVLTDPSYAGQAVCMTYPIIGNYGIITEDMESTRIWPDGFIVRELSRKPSNFRADMTIQDFLLKYDIPGIIKTKEYVDMDALEAYLYNMYKDETRLLDDSISAISRDIANCREVKEEVRLTVKAAKKKKEDE